MSGNRTTPVRATPVTDATLVEVFSSIQGEGLYIGCRQIFIRLAECNLACDYCDTDFRKASLWQAETAPGSGFFTDLPNPVDGDELIALIQKWIAARPGAHHSISITGGEPLCQAEALGTWLPRLRRLLPVHLETNGTLPDALAPLLAHLDFISMDLKLASVTGCATPWEAHRRFMALCAGSGCQIKAVVGPATSNDELVAAAVLVQELAPDAPLILQPQTIDNRSSLAADRLLSMQAIAAAHHPATRVIPQLHRFLDVP